MSFNSTNITTTDTPLPDSVNKQSAIALLHDHPAFQSLQPLLVENVVLSASQASSASSWLVDECNEISSSLPGKPAIEYRSVTVGVPIGPFTNNIVTTSGFIDIDDGTIIVFHAPMGLYGQNTFHVVDTGEGNVLREEARLTGFRLMMPFVMKTEKKSHGEAGQAFARKLGEMQRATDG